MNYKTKQLFDKHPVNRNNEKQREELIKEKEFIENTLERMGEYYDNIKEDYPIIRLVCQGEAGSEKRKKGFEYLYDFTGDFRKRLDKFVKIFVTKFWDKNWDSISASEMTENERKEFYALSLNKENNPYNSEKCTALLQRYIDVDNKIKTLDTNNNLPVVIEKFNALVKDFEDYKRKTNESLKDISRTVEYNKHLAAEDKHDLYVQLGGRHYDHDSRFPLGGGYYQRDSKGNIDWEATRQEQIREADRRNGNYGNW